MSFHPRSDRILAQVRFLAYHRIKPHAPPLVRTPANSFEFQPCGRTAQVRFLAYHRIKPHAPPLVRTTANSFEFLPCGRTSQVGYLMLSLRHTLCIAYVEYPSFRAWTTRVSNPV